MTEALLTHFAVATVGVLTLAAVAAWAYVLWRDLRKPSV